MRISITMWTILALNGFVAVEALVLGWIAQDAAGRVVEERLAKDMVASVSTFLSTRAVPVNSAMLDYLHEMLHSDWVAVADGGSHILGTSLTNSLAADFAKQLGQIEPAGTISLGGRSFHVDSHELASNNLPLTTPQSQSNSLRLYVLIPLENLRDARRQASNRVMRALGPTAIVATLLAALLAFATTRPIRRLTRAINELAISDGSNVDNDLFRGPETTQASDEPLEILNRQEFVSRGPTETRQLASAFFKLIDRLASAREQLTQSERLATLGKVCLSVAHELRNPLSGIKMNIRVLQDRADGANNPGIDAIAHEIDRMGLYLDELMTLAPGSASGTRPRLIPVKLSALCESVLTILAGRFQHAKVELKTNYSAAEPHASADPNQVRQVMMNLIVNAVEAMPTGGTLTISVEPGPSAVKFMVADTGPGVHADGADVFAAFTSGKLNGIGLGLYLSKQVVIRHNGRIGYDNGPAGAVFWFELPVAGASAAGV